MTYSCPVLRDIIIKKEKGDMLVMNDTIFQKAKTFIYRNARPLDFARWQYHFENASQETVLSILSHYQNEDGGFGHALENDYWNPASSPIQTWTAAKIIKEINFYDHNHPMIKGILNYLSSGVDFNGRFWYRTVPSNDHFPHAPWWNCDTDYSQAISYNPTASLAGFILFHADKDDCIYKTALRIADEAISFYMSDRSPERHVIKCYIELMDYCEIAKVSDIDNLPEFKAKLLDDVSNSFERDRAKWENTYCCKPSSLIESKDSIFYFGNEDICEFECKFIAKTQQDNGAWKITWSWNDYVNEFAISANWWQSSIIIENLLFLKAFDKL